MDVSLDRCVCNVLEVENEEYDVIVLVLHWSYQNTAQERRTCTTMQHHRRHHHHFLRSFQFRKVAW